MSHPNVQVGHPNRAVAANLSRPATLLVTLGLALATAAIGVVDQILFLTGGRDAVLASFSDLGLDDLGNVLGDSFLSSQIDSAVDTLNFRAYVALTFVVLLLVFALFAGQIWANVLTTITAVIVLVISLVQFADLGTGAMTGLAGLTALLAIATLVLVWMPPNRRYVKAKSVRNA